MNLKALIGHTALSTIPVQRICLCDLSGSFRMKEIQLTQGFFALVDDEDYELLNQYLWFAKKHRNTIYAMRGLHHDGVHSSIRMHRQIMNPLKNMQVDHINHNGLDNRKENLRVVTNRENLLNRIKKNSTGYSGVYKSLKRYRAAAQINGIKYDFGAFDTALEAHNKYMEVISNLKTETNE